MTVQWVWPTSGASHAQFRAPLRKTVRAASEEDGPLSRRVSGDVQLDITGGGRECTTKSIG